MAFRAAYIFDVERTDRMPLPESARPTGEPGAYLEGLKAAVEERNIVLEDRELPGTTFGTSAGGRIILKAGLEPAEESLVLAHELAHEMLHEGSADTDRTVRESQKRMGMEGCPRSTTSVWTAGMPYGCTPSTLAGGTGSGRVRQSSSHRSRLPAR